MFHQAHYESFLGLEDVDGAEGLSTKNEFEFVMPRGLRMGECYDSFMDV